MKYLATIALLTMTTSAQATTLAEEAQRRECAQTERSAELKAFCDVWKSPEHWAQKRQEAERTQRERTRDADQQMARATIYNDLCEPLSMNGVDVWYMARVSLRRGFISQAGFDAESRNIRAEVASQLIERRPNDLDGPSPTRKWCASNAATVKQFLTSTFRITDR